MTILRKIAFESSSLVVCVYETIMHGDGDGQGVEEKRMRLAGLVVGLLVVEYY